MKPIIAIQEMHKKENRVKALEELIPLIIQQIKTSHPSHCQYQDMNRRLRDLSSEYRLLTGRSYG